MKPDEIPPVVPDPKRDEDCVVAVDPKIPPGLLVAAVLPKRPPTAIHCKPQSYSHN